MQSLEGLGTSSGTHSGDEMSTQTSTPTSSADTDTDTTSDSAEGGTKFDMASLPDTDDEPSPPSCKVVDNMDAVGICEESAPPDSFDPDEQWTFFGPAGFDESIVSPLVVNLTDDEIDLCDIHDLDGDGFPEFGASTPQHYGVWEFDQTELWLANIADPSGQAGGTAFDSGRRRHRQ